jgi:hypothetical protein
MLFKQRMNVLSMRTQRGIKPMQAYEGYLDKGRIIPLMPLVSFRDRRRVIITILDEPINEKPDTWAELDRLSNEVMDEEKSERIKWLNKLHAAVKDAAAEETPDFPRATFNRELIDFSIEG